MYNGSPLILDLSFPIDADEDTTTEKNYVDYDVFYLRSRLEHALGSGSPYRVDLIPIEWNDRMHMSVQLHRGPEAVPIQPATRLQLEETLASIKDRHCVLLGVQRSFAYKGVCLPKSWIRSVLPWVVPLLPPITEPYLGPDGTLYAYFGWKKHTYGVHFSKTLTIVQNTLWEWFEQGTIRLDPELDADFRRQWCLIPFEPHLGLYKPAWIDRILTGPSPVAFLEALREGQPIRLEVAPNLVARHRIAEVLRSEGRKAVFCDAYLLLYEIEGYREASILLELVLGSLVEYNGFVVTGDQAQDPYLEYTDVIRGPIKSQYIKIA